MMKKTTRLQAGLLVLLLALPAAGRPHRLFAGQPDSPEQRQTRSLRLLRISINSDQLVTITTESTITDAVSYISGERYVVVIPQAVVAGMNSDLASRFFTNLQIDQRAEDVAISFLLKPGSVGRLEPRANGLSVVFAAVANTWLLGRRHGAIDLRSLPLMVGRTAAAAAVGAALVSSCRCSQARNLRAFRARPRSVRQTA